MLWVVYHPTNDLASASSGGTMSIQDKLWETFRLGQCTPGAADTCGSRYPFELWHFLALC